MDWIKVKTRHIICDFDSIDPQICWAWIQLMGMTATLERIPVEEQMRYKVGNETYDKLADILKRNETSLIDVLGKVMEDVDKYNTNKERHREYVKSSRDTSHNTHVKRKIREDKIREDKIIKHIYGVYRHVRLTDQEHKDLMGRFGEKGCNEWITKLDEGIEAKGYKYKNHHLVILQWAKKDEPKQKTGGMADVRKELNSGQA